jgi:Family of unknown function (DUF6675)
MRKSSIVLAILALGVSISALGQGTVGHGIAVNSGSAEETVVRANSDYPWPPCGGDTYPAYPRVDAAPAVEVWSRNALGPDWDAPACVEWKTSSATMLVALAGRFRYRDGANAMLGRIGAISSLSSVRYWSVTDGRWERLFTRASALDDTDPRMVRTDFSPAELDAGHDFHFLAADNRSSEDMVWRLHVEESGSGVFVQTENVTPMRWLFIPIVPSGGLQTSYFLQPDSRGEWRLYSLTRVLYVSRFFAYFVPRESYVNRAVALYRHFAALRDRTDPQPSE